MDVPTAPHVERAYRNLKAAILGALGRYGGGYEILPAWVDIACVCAFAIFIFQLSLHLTVTAAESAAEIERDAHQLESA